MTPVLLSCFWPIVILVSGYAYGSGVKTVDLYPAGQRSAPILAAGSSTRGAADSSNVEYVESLEPLYDFLIQLRLHKLCKLLREAQLEDILLDTGSFTIFAPTDGSFVFLPGGTLEEIRRNPQWLRDFLLHHIVAGDLSSQKIQDELLVTSLQGASLRFNIYGSGQVYTVSGSQILSFDLPFELGRLHVIDHPLYPIPESDILGYLEPTNSQLYRLVLFAGLPDFLRGGTYTIFVPDDKAFGYLSQDLLDALNRNRTLAERIVLNHVLHGSVYTRGITNGMQLESVGGAPLSFTQSRGLTFVNGVPIVSPDIPVTNGVVHIINRVLLPEDIDTDCHCKSSRDGSASGGPRIPSRTTTGGAERGGVSGRPQTPGIDSTRRPSGQIGQQGTPDSPYRPGKPQTPGTSISTGSDGRPDSPRRTQGSGRPSAGGPGLIPAGPFIGSQTQSPGSPHRGSGRPGSPHGVGHTPEDQILPQDHETQQIPGDNFVPGHPRAPGSTFGTGQSHRPGTSIGTGQPHTPGGSFGGRQPQTPGSSFGTGQPQTPAGAFETGSSQKPGSSLGSGQQPIDRRPGSSFEQPQSPDSIFGTRPVQRPDSSFETDQQQPTGGAFGTQPDHLPEIGQPQTPGSFGTGTAQRPGSSSGTTQSQVPDNTFGTGQDQRPGSHITKGQAQRPGQGQRPQGTSSPRYPQSPGSRIREPQIPVSGIKEPQRPESGIKEPQRPVSGIKEPQKPDTGIKEPLIPESEIEESQRPGSGLPRRPGVPVGTGQPGRPGSTTGQFPVGTGQPGRPGSTTGQFPVGTGQPGRPGSTTGQFPVGTGQPGRPGSTTGQFPVGTGQPGRPGSSTGHPQSPESSVGTEQTGKPGSISGYPQRPENDVETDQSDDGSREQQIPGSTFETGQPERVGSLRPDEKPGVPGRTKVNQPGRVPLPPPPTRAPPSRTRTTRYPGSHQRGTPDDGSGGSPAGSVRGPYRPTRAPSTSPSHGSRYPRPGTQSRVTPTRSPHVTSSYPDSEQDQFPGVPGQTLQPGRTDTRKQPSTQRPQTQPGRHRTPEPVSESTRRPGPHPPTDRPSTGQLRPVPTRAPVPRPGSRPGSQTNCRQPGERITPSNRNLPLCSTQDVSQQPCQNLDRPYNPSDPRPQCPDSDSTPQGCRDALEPPGLNDRRPVCRLPQSRPKCRKYNEPRDGRPLCPGSSRNCRLPEEPDNPSNPLPICQDVVSVEGCRRPDEPYYPRDRRPECPPDDCRPPQEPLRPGDTRPLCTVNEEDSIRQPLVPTTAKPRYPQQPIPGSQTEGTPGSGQSKPGKQPSEGVISVGGKPQTPSWQQPQTPRQPSRAESVTTRKPGKQPQISPINPSDVSPDDNDALISPGAYPPGRPGYPGFPQDTRRQGQTSPVIDEPSYPQTVDREHPEDRDHDQPGWPHSTAQRPSGQPGTSQTTPQRPGSQSGYPHSTAQRPSGQPGASQTTPQRPGSQTGYPHSPAQRPSGQPGVSQTTQQRPGSQSGYPQSPAQRPSGQPGVSQTTQQRPGSQSGYPHYPDQEPSGQPGTSQTTPQRPGSQSEYPHSPAQRPPGQPGVPQTTPQKPGSQSGYPHSPVQEPLGQPDVPPSTPQRPGSQSGYPHSPAERPSEQSSVPQTIPQRPGSQSGYPHSGGQRPTSPSGGSYPGSRPAIVPQQQPESSGPSSSTGDDSARSLLNIVRDPGLQIKGHPVRMTIVLDLFEKAGLLHILEGPGPATAFLPSDDAFKKLPRGVVEQLRENPELLQRVLLYHVVAREVRPSAQETSFTVPTLEGMSLVVTMLKEGRLILIGGAKAVAVTRASNGIFYVINELLYPLPHEDIVSALKSRPDLTQVTSLVQRSGLTQMLKGSKPFTLFAPTDAAFRDLPASTLQVITQNSTAIQELLLGHIVEGAHFGREFLVGGVFPNARGGKLRFKVLSYGYTVNDANIKTPEIVTGTGVIHLVDQVLLEPEDFQSLQEQPQPQPQGIPIGGVNVVRVDVSDSYDNYPEIAELARGMGLNKFLSWFTNTGLIEKVHDGGSYTVLAPTDAAVNSLPDNMIQAIDSDPDQVRPLLKFHIITQHIDLNTIRNEQTVATLLPDKRIRFNVIRDGPEEIVTACGVPLTVPQGSGLVRLVAVNQPLYPPTGSLAQVLEASPILQNLAKAVRTYHLTWMFTGQGPATIFAPSDAAFEALSDEDKKNLIENRQAFTELLKRHVVKGSVYSSGIQDGMQLRNENRETLTFSVHPGGISVNSIPISYSDVTATNGVLHVIDHFL